MTRSAFLGLPVSMMLVFACVGEDPASPTVIVINDNDGSTPDGGGGNVEGGQSEGGGELSCTDKAKNGKETDVDCGGGACPKCDANKACVDNGDCATGICAKGFCQLANVPAWLPGPLLPYEGTTTKRGRSDFTLLHANGVIYAIGGWINDTDTSVAPSGVMDYLDVKAGATSWTRSADTIGPRTNSAAALGPDGKLYVFGGISVPFPNTFVSPATWLRDATTGAANWSNLGPPMSQGRTSFAAAVADQKVFAFGGADKDGVRNASIESMKLSPDAWTASGTVMSAARADHGAATADGKIYVVGGTTPTGFTALVEAFDPTNNTIVARADMPTGRGRHAVVAAPDGRIYAIGGESATGGQGRTTVEAYSPSTNTWVTVTSLTTPRTRVAATVGPDGRIWIVGGRQTNSGELLATVEIYGPLVTLQGSSFARGAKIPVSGSNFAPGASVNVFLDSVTSAPVATTTSDNAGAMKAVEITVPAAAASGAHSLIAIDSLSKYPVTIAFTVN